jgi:hypothetical protein
VGLSLKTRDEALDKRINYSVFAVMQGKTLYVNCYILPILMKAGIIGAEE